MLALHTTLNSNGCDVKTKTARKSGQETAWSSSIQHEKHDRKAVSKLDIRRYSSTAGVIGSDCLDMANVTYPGEQALKCHL